MSKDDENTDIRFLNFNSTVGSTISTKETLDDKDLMDFNDARTRFYIELIKSKEKNPELVNKLFYKFNNINNRKKIGKSIYRKIKLNKKNYKNLGNNDEYEKLFEDIKSNLKDEKNKPKPSSEKVPVEAKNDVAPLAPYRNTQAQALRNYKALAQQHAQALRKYEAQPPAPAQPPRNITKGGGGIEEYTNNEQKYIEDFNELKSGKDFKKKFLKETKLKYGLKNVPDYDEKNYQDDNNPMQKFIDNFYKANSEYKKDIVKVNSENAEVKEAEVKEAEKNLRKGIISAVEDFDNDPMNPLDILEIKNDDRIIFMAITFVIRYLTLLLVNWCVEIDMIKSFNQAFILFTFIYITIFWLVVMIINVNISSDTSDDLSIIGKVQSVLYYFHFRINDIGRLLVHTLLILLLLIIPIIIKSENKLNDDPLTYEERLKLYNTLSLFTMFMWIFTSIIASKY